MSLNEPTYDELMANPEPTMPWGKYAGQDLSDIPTGYLDWLIGNDWMSEPNNAALRDTILVHLDTRSDWKRIDTSAE